MSAIVQHARSSSPELLTISDPRTGGPVGSLPVARPLAIRRTVNAALAAHPGWSATAPAARANCLRDAARALAAAAAELAELNSRETGRPADEAAAGIAAGVATLEQYAELGPVHRGHSLRATRWPRTSPLPSPVV